MSTPVNVGGHGVGLSFLLRVAALVVFILAIFVAGGHLTWGVWQEWASVGLALWVGSTLVP